MNEQLSIVELAKEFSAITNKQIQVFDLKDFEKPLSHRSVIRNTSLHGYSFAGKDGLFNVAFELINPDGISMTSQSIYASNANPEEMVLSTLNNLLELTKNPDYANTISPGFIGFYDYDN